MTFLRFSLFAVASSIAAFSCNSLMAQEEDVDYSIYEFFRMDLDHDLTVNMDDVDIFCSDTLDNGLRLGRNARYPVTEATAHLDFDLDGFISILDLSFILDYFGHFDTDTLSFQFVNLGGCQIPDFNADGDIDCEDYDIFVAGIHWWHFANRFLPFKIPAWYGFGDANLDGKIDELDYDYIRSLWTGSSEVGGDETFDASRYPMPEFDANIRPSQDKPDSFLVWELWGINF